MGDGGPTSDSSEEIDPPSAHLIKKTASAVGRECEVRCEREVQRIIEHTGAAGAFVAGCASRAGEPCALPQSGSQR